MSSIPLFFRELIKDKNDFWLLPFRYLPEFLQLQIANQVGNTVFKKSLEDDELSFLEKKTVRIKVQDLGFDWSVSTQHGRLIFNSGSEACHTMFTGNAMEYLLLATRQEDPDTLFFQRRLSIEGDTELGLQVKNLLDSIDIEQLPPPLQATLAVVTNVTKAFNK